MDGSMRFVFSLAAVSALVASAVGQTFTSCNPLNVTCPADQALGTAWNESYTGSNALSSIDTTYWNVTGAPPPEFGSDGMTMTISKYGEAPTMQTNFYLFGGHVEVVMMASPGQGIVSSIVLLSDDLDEIDWEIMGGNTTSVENNYYGKGNVSEMNALYYACDNPATTFHNYTVNWDENKIDWILDGNVVRTVMASDAIIPGSDNVTMFPQTPMQLKIGSWAAGSVSSEGTVEWAGGKTDFSKGPFTMVVKSIGAIDATGNATTYTYGDNTGSWGSIKVAEGQSPAAIKINGDSTPSPSIAQRWSSMSSTAQIAIIAATAAAGLILLGLFTWCCCRSRRARKHDKIDADPTWNKEQVELLEYKRMMGNGAGGSPGWNGQYAGNPDAFVSHYDPPAFQQQNTGYGGYSEKSAPYSHTAQRY